MGSAPALCRESLHGHCARRVPDCSRLHAQPRRLASGVRTMPPRGWAGAGRGCGEGSAGGAGGASPRRGEGAGLESPGARRWKLPSAAGCTTRGCGRGRGAEGGRACVRRGCWPRRLPARLPGRVLEAGGAVLGEGGSRAPRSGDQPGTGGSRWERGQTGRCAQGGCSARRLRSPVAFPPRPPAQRCLTLAPSRPRPSLGKGAAAPAPWPCPTLLRPRRPLPAPQAGRGSTPSPWDSG